MYVALPQSVSKVINISWKRFEKFEEKIKEKNTVLIKARGYQNKSFPWWLGS
jgi:hypothetical protein